MLEKCVDYMINQQVQARSITEEDIVIYQYGYTLLLEVVLNIVCAIVIGCIMVDIQIMGFLLLMIIPLRSFCGGWHASKVWQCTILSNLALVCVIVMAKYVLIYCPVAYLIIADIIMAGVIWIVSPVDTKTKRLTTVEKKVLKKKVFLILVIQMILLSLLIIWNLIQYMAVIVMTHFVVMVLVCLGKWVNRCYISYVFKKSRTQPEEGIWNKVLGIECESANSAKY